MGTETHDENAIEVVDLRRRYGPAGEGGFDAVRGVSFTVARGELFALLGSNGAGKTSTVELLEGLDRPDGGRIRVLGMDPYADRARVRPRTGVMLQEGGFPSDLTVAETARLWASCTSRSRPYAEVLELVGLTERHRVRTKQLSGGERRRLDLALALLNRPDVLFLDEPTTGLDPAGRRDTWELIRELRDSGTTVLLTTHYLEEAEELADRVAIMRKGRIEVSGTLPEIRSSQPSRIRFRLPAETAARHLPVPAVVDGERVEIRTGELQEALTGLLLWAREHGVELRGLDARSASLEEAYLDLVAEDEGSGQPAPNGPAGTAARTEATAR